MSRASSLALSRDGAAWYPVPVLAQLLSVPDFARSITVTVDDVVAFARSRNFVIEWIDGEPHLDHAALGAFLDQFATELRVPRRRHGIPAFLRECRSPWAVALLAMYEGDLSWPAALPPLQGEFLKTLVGNTNPSIVVEIGCFIGISSVWMAAALEELGGKGSIHSIDLFTEIMPGPHAHHRYHADPLGYATDALAAAGLSHRVQFHAANSHQAVRLAPEIVREPIDLLYIDGDHSIEGCFADFLTYTPYVRAGGYIVLHDIYPEACGCDGPRWLIDNVLEGSADFRILELPTVGGPHDANGGYGIALIRKLRSSSSNLQEARAGLLQPLRREPAKALVRKARRSLGFAQGAPKVSYRESQQALARANSILASLDEN